MGRKTTELKILCSFNEEGESISEIIRRCLWEFVQEELRKNAGC